MECLQNVSTVCPVQQKGTDGCCCGTQMHKASEETVERHRFLGITWELGHVKLPTGYQPPLITPSSSPAPILRKNTLNSGEPAFLMLS